ncbi:hypothetical protein O3M35_011070 [Rhynocoris fuscipes]|uniref:Kinetochore protein NDC80 n=1 Tax=Rhynocoris fuscipes TaxID=488301 RepID=A0AAW1CV04_9HEMI
MKKSSLGRRSSTAPPQRMTFSELESTRRTSGIPVRSRTSSADRNMSLSTSTLIRSKSQTNLRAESAYNSNYDRRLTGTGTERPSRGTTTSSARMSSYGGSKSKRDNRPLQDKQWQMVALRMVEDVLRNIPEGRSLIEGGIKPLTIKRFLDITNLLLFQLDISIELNSANYVIEIPYLAKLMLYRGKVDKSWLISANTPHAFAHVLGFLHFLASCYQVKIQVDPIALMYPQDFSGNSHDSWKFKELLPYFQESYSLFCNDDPNYLEKQKELDSHILQSHFSDKDIICSKIKALEAENTKYEEMINKKKTENHSLKKDVAELEAFCDELHHDYDRQAEDVSLIKDEIKQLEDEIVSLDSEKKSILASFEEKKKTYNNLQKSIENQRVSRVDIKQIRENCATLQRQAEYESLYLEEYENQIFQEDLTLVDLQNELQLKIREYTLMLDKLDDSSLENAKIPGNVQDQDVEVIQRACNCLIDVQSKFANLIKDKNSTSKDSVIGEYKTTIAELESKCDNLEEKINAVKEEINNELLQHTKKLHELKIDLEAIEEKRLELKKSMPENCEEHIRRQKIKAEEMEVDLQEYRKRVKIIISERLKMFKLHKENVAKFFREHGINFPEKFS